MCNFYQLVEDVSDHRELSSEQKNLIVFNDLLLEKQNISETCYDRARHSNVDCCFLAQTISSSHAKQSERTPISLCLFPQDLKSVNQILDDHVESDMTKEDCRQLCKTS